MVLDKDLKEERKKLIINSSQDIYKLAIKLGDYIREIKWDTRELEDYYFVHIDGSVREYGRLVESLKKIDKFLTKAKKIKDDGAISYFQKIIDDYAKRVDESRLEMLHDIKKYENEKVKLEKKIKTAKDFSDTAKVEANAIYEKCGKSKLSNSAMRSLRGERIILRRKVERTNDTFDMINFFINLNSTDEYTPKNTIEQQDLIEYI